VRIAGRRDSVDRWIGRFLLPMMGNTPENAIGATIDNQFRATAKEPSDAGNLP